MHLYGGRDKDHIVTRGLTLEGAQAHCRDPRTSSTTADSEWAVKYTAENGPWFHGYEEEN